MFKKCGKHFQEKSPVIRLEAVLQHPNLTNALIGSVIFSVNERINERSNNKLYLPVRIVQNVAESMD